MYNLALIQVQSSRSYELFYFFNGSVIGDIKVPATVH